MPTTAQAVPSVIPAITSPAAGAFFWGYFLFEVPSKPALERTCVNTRLCSIVEFLEIAINAPLAERDAPLRREICGDARPLGDAIVQRHEQRNPFLETLHALGKCVAQTFDDLKQRQVNVSEPSPDHILAAVVLEHAFEIAQKLRRAIAPEIGRAPLRRRLLLLVIEPAGNRVMRVVNVYD